MGQSKIRRAPRPRLRWRHLDVAIPAPAYEEFKKAHARYLQKHGRKEQDFGERAFALHLMVAGVTHMLRELDREDSAHALVVPATHVPPAWAREASENLQALKRSQ